MNYSYIFGSNYPTELIPVGTKKDIDDNVKDLILQYYALIDSGDTDNANALYENNKNILEPYLIDMTYVNRLEEEIYNIGLTVLKQTTNMISAAEPIAQDADGYWYQDY